MINNDDITKRGNLSRGKNIVSTSFNFDKDPEYQTLKALYIKIKDKYKVPATEIISKLEKKEILIPSCIFDRKLSVFEAIVKYLKENLGLANRDIALLTSKSQKSIWQAYNFARKKVSSVFEIVASDYYVPVSVLKKPFTVFESVVKYLKEDVMLNFHEIGILLKRDDRTIWTIYQRIIKKK